MYLSQMGLGGLEFSKATKDKYCLMSVTSKGNNSFIFKTTEHYFNVVNWPFLDRYDLAAMASTPEDGSIVTLMKIGSTSQGADTFYIHTAIFLSNGEYANISMTNVAEDYYVWNMGSLHEGRIIRLDWSASPSGVMIIEPAIVNREITNVVYAILNAQVSELPPNILTFTLDNSGADPDGEATMTETYQYKVSEFGTWNNTLGYEVSVATEFTAGIPFIATNTTTVSVTQSGSFSWGGQNGKEVSRDFELTAVVPVGSIRRAVLTISQAKLDVSFTYQEKLIYSNGEVAVRDGEGIYRNVDSWNAHGTVEDI